MSRIIFASIGLLQDSDSEIDAVPSNSEEVPEDARFSRIRSYVSVSYIATTAEVLSSAYQYLTDHLQVPSSQAGAVVPDDARAQDVLKELLSDAGSMHGRQEQMDQLLAQMKKENGALWQEVSRLRQKHLKQQQIVGKLIHFLITMVQANRNITVKRKIPLMLHGSAGTGSKIPRLAKNAFVADYHVSSPAGSQVSDGPVIRDVTDLMEDLGETSATASDLMSPAQSPKAVEESAPVTPVRLISSAAFSGLDSGCLGASLLNATEGIEPLCLLDPLQDEG
ncbi:hypothetical protein HPB51_000868 [Rhipicephalus microplus]|uniref:Uncharacterized protein n=1 Tax=Rhipicephalus microplus TaxID=6941 RepID=A0A9J6D8G5_RHIMP|nr:hypothetical protein HPB51_000868 [Rhipicephalus microplus]